MSAYLPTRSTISAGSVETIQRDAACSAVRAEASRSISRGSSTPTFCSPGSARAAHSRVSSIARWRSVSYATFTSIIISIVPGSRPAFFAPSCTAGMRVFV